MTSSGHVLLLFKRIFCFLLLSFVGTTPLCKNSVLPHQLQNYRNLSMQVNDLRADIQGKLGEKSAEYEP